MNKIEFLKKLSSLLHILQEDEVKDILDEYEQHIDMKLAQGMSETEAISAFGSVEELATEILSAYHVRPDFKAQKENKVLEKMQDGSKKAIGNAGNVVKNVGNKTGSVVRKFFEKVKNICKKPFLWLDNCKTKWKEKRMKTTDEKREEENMEQDGKKVSFGRRLINLMKSMIHFVIRCIYRCVFLCTGLVEAVLLICAGILFVLLVLGYPVAGITIAVVGAGMSLFVVAYYAAKHMRRIK